MQRRHLAWLLATACIAGTAPAAGAAEYPARPIRMVVPSGPGTITDQTARVVAEGLTQTLGQSVVIENRPGANGIVASETVARAEPDGYTLLFTYAATHAINPWLIKSLSYDPVQDFTPIAMPSGGGGNVLLVNAEVPIRDLQGFIDYVKQSQEPPSYCSWGVGSGGHLTMAFLEAKADLELRHIPYKTATQCANDIAAGHVPFGFTDTVSPQGHIKAGKARPIAVSGPVRIDAVPNVPTMKEQGIPFEQASWLGIFGPKGLDPAIVARLNDSVNAIITSPEQRERFIAMNLRPGERTTPEEFADRLKTDIAAWGKIVDTAGLEPE
ncbi:tripartite tricarboxylate transporter substrate binding protein [Verticiella sediminum]|uniref:Tripartite tricarboxylate transporter substrate binding protein n=1 Tax=Verticiella sediminum TaxID=1247510 RepID=A0A556AGU6_9BURK|nr:tripartite tricarboxylate transporter substrate binding protein [Verticiella sediminum]TSH92105.1 tripartite tricarboxylate transporter substrate binding protein [Verticiella sediminum]